jgi:phosphoglycerate dehydrogenase-like enzyme
MRFIIANEQSPKQYMEATFDLPFASKKWQRTVLVRRKGKTWFARHHLETCVFSYLAEELKSGDLCVAGSEQFTPNRSLAGMTATILGFGGIGRATARLMRAFGMKIYAINHSGKSSESVDFLGTLHDLEHVLRASDVVVISLPLTRATRGLIGKEQLAWMKPDAILVNVARGAILDEEALYNHVKSHPAFMLGIDAWWTEPFLHGQFRMEYPFLDLPNVLGSPHNSAVVPQVLAGATRQATENVKHFLKGEQVMGMARREDYLE